MIRTSSRVRIRSFVMLSFVFTNRRTRVKSTTTRARSDGGARHLCCTSWCTTTTHRDAPLSRVGETSVKETVTDDVATTHAHGRRRDADDDDDDDDDDAVAFVGKLVWFEPIDNQL